MAGWEGSFADRERITDSNFTVFGKVPKKFHIECESENSFPEYNSDEQKLEELKTEYKVILQRLDELEGQGVIGAFDKRTIIELSGDVIKEIAQKYKNVQKGVGDMMRGELIETTSRKLKNEAENETKRKTALRMLKMGKLTIAEIAECSDLSVEEVERLAGLQTV